jgi:uracil-DNA glycosylase
MSDAQSLAELLRWYVAMGADEAIAAEPLDRLPPPAVAAPQGAPMREAVVPVSPAPRLPAAPSPGRDAPAGAASARRLAAEAATLAELAAAVSTFDGCVLKRTATNTVFADGIAGAPLMVIGEAPGADEDRLGKPFVGRAGQMLDRMLASVGFDRRRNAYITNVLFWRPPGNRKPTGEEIAACLPFVFRQIALLAPKAVLMSGGTAMSALVGVEGITRQRGRWFDLAIDGLPRPVPALATYHPSFLLRSPARKNEAWRDLLSLQSKLKDAQ